MTRGAMAAPLARLPWLHMVWRRLRSRREERPLGRGKDGRDEDHRHAPEAPARPAKRGKLRFSATVQPSAESQGKCRKCGGEVRRSHATGILWRACSGCRYLMMIYGPNIGVTRVTP